MNHLIFTYGTLKRGFHNHDQWLKGAKFLLETKTVNAGYEMFPEKGVFPIVGWGNYNISGEVFVIQEETLRNLDVLEAEGTFYHRIEVPVVGIEYPIWMYIVKDRTLILDYPELNFLVKTTGNTQEWLNIENFEVDNTDPE